MGIAPGITVRSSLRGRMQTIEIHVSGKVQKVGFRSCVKRIAQKLNIHGEVMNLPDGSVRIVATGEKIVLDKFVSMIYGCPRAVIRDMKFTDREFNEFYEFTVRRPNT
jgi:acylphosphatase